MIVLAFFFLIFAVWFFIMAGNVYNDSGPVSVTCFSMGAILIFLSILVAYQVFQINGYKQGQIDYMNGIVKYQKIQKDDYKEIK